MADTNKPDVKKAASMTSAKYQLSSTYAKRAHTLVILNKQHVNLTGEDYTVKTKGSKLSPPREYTYRKATQEDLKLYYEQAILLDDNGKPMKDANGNEISKQPVVIKISNGNNESTSDT